MIGGVIGQAGIGGVLQDCLRQRIDGSVRFRAEGRRDAITLTFSDGHLVDARPDKRPMEELLGERLVREGALSKSDLKRALGAHKRTRKRLGEVLTDLNLLDSARIQHAIDIQCQDTLYELFEWRTGEYEQLPLDQPVVRVMSHVSMDAILGEGFRRLEEWPVIRARLSNYKLVFEQVAAALDEHEQQQLSEAQRRLLPLVDGKCTVFQLIQRSGLGEFSVAKGLASLMSRGLIKAKRGHSFSEDPMGRHKKRFGVVFWRLIWNLSLVGFAVIVFAGDGDWLETDPVSMSESSGTLVDPAFVRLELAEFVETYRVFKKQYPKDLEALQNAQLFLADRVAAAKELGLELISIGSDYDIRVVKENDHARP